MTDTEVAYHEAGHGVLGVKQGMRVQAIAILARPSASMAGYCKWGAPAKDLLEHVPLEYLVAKLGGFAAQARHNPHADPDCAGPDFDSVRQLCWVCVESQGHPREDQDREIDALFHRLQQLAHVHVSEPLTWQWITRTAHELVRRRRLEHEDIERLRHAR